MPGSKKDNWQPWIDEIKCFKARETEGLDKDLTALEAHIKKLREICPKDSERRGKMPGTGSGYPATRALIYLHKLQTRLDGVRSYLAGVS